MKRISLFVSDRQYEEFKALAESWDQATAELIRQALNEFLERHAAGRGVSQKKSARKRATTRKRA